MGRILSRIPMIGSQTPGSWLLHGSLHACGDCMQSRHAVFGRMGKAHCRLLRLTSRSSSFTLGMHQLLQDQVKGQNKVLVALFRVPRVCAPALDLGSPLLFNLAQGC